MDQKNRQEKETVKHMSGNITITTLIINNISCLTTLHLP